MRKILPLLLLVFLCGCTVKKDKQTAEYFDVLDTYSTVTIYNEDEGTFENVTKELHEEIRRYDSLFNIYNEYDGINNLKTVNDNAGIQSVAVDEDIINLLKDAKQYYEMTDGRVNVAMGSVLSIWHDYRENAINNNVSALPTDEELQSASKHTDINNIVIDEENSTVYIAEKGESVDVGAVAKGYIADRAKEFLLEKGITSAIISLGGNVVVIGTPPDKPNWVIGVQNPDTENAEFAATVEIASGSAVTSGDYQRYYEYNGKRYCHIIDTKTLYPAEYVHSVTVMTENSEFADAMSTALFTMDYENGKKLADSLNLKCVWVLSDGTVEKNY
jgi:thiamine biosynthesis lipoprotein